MADAPCEILQGNKTSNPTVRERNAIITKQNKSPVSHQFCVTLKISITLIDCLSCIVSNS